MDEKEKQLRFLLRVAYGAGWLLLIFVVARYVMPFLLPALLGFCIAWLMRPAAGFITRHSGMGRKGAAVVSATLFFGVAAIVLWLLGLLLYSQVSNWGERLPALYKQAVGPFLRDYSARFGAWVSRFFPQAGVGMEQAFAGIDTGLANAFAEFSARSMECITGLLSKIPAFATGLIFTVLSTVLICVEYEKVCAFVMGQIPLRWRETALCLRDYLAATLLRVLWALIQLSLIAFALLLAGLLLLGVPRAPIIAAVIALLDLLPVIGSGVVLVPWGIYRLLLGDTVAGIGLLALWVLVSATKEFLEPRVLGNRIGQNPVVTLIAMYAGLKIAGFFGLIGFPVVCLALEYLQRKGMLRLYRQTSA